MGCKHSAFESPPPEYTPLGKDSAREQVIDTLAALIDKCYLGEPYQDGLRAEHKKSLAAFMCNCGFVNAPSGATVHKDDAVGIAEALLAHRGDAKVPDLVDGRLVWPK